MTEILWAPSGEAVRRTALWRFAKDTQPLHGAEPDDYGALLQWSIDSPDAYHDALWDALGIVGDKGRSAFLLGETMRDAQFYPGARLNYAENLLQRRDDGLAIIAHREDGTRRTMSWGELYDAVSLFAQFLLAAEVGRGDRVAAIVTHDIEAIVGYLATAAIGAIWSSCSPDFGPAGAADRLCQIDPKVLIATPGYSYAGRQIDVVPTIRAVAEGSHLARLVTIGAVPATLADLPALSWADALAGHEPREIAFARLEFAAPMVILYSSGTTGKPKCITHSGAGLLIQHKKELALHCDIRADDRFFYFTTCGWMMWNWQVSGLALGATLVTYDGSPSFPGPERLLDLIDSEAIAIFGTSARYLDATRKAGRQPRLSHRLDRLRLILSTGSPLLPATFDHVYTDWKHDLLLASISGGTDICACFLGGNPMLPVRRGELQCALLGMDIDTLDEAGRSVTGVPGELVCRNAHLSMPVQFWGDADGSRYTEAYFTRFPGLWAHADFVEQRPSGGYVIHGRSDTTLNPGGVRIGTAEIYRQLEGLEAIEEAVVVGQKLEGDERVILFVKLRPGHRLDAALEHTIRTRIRSGASPRHTPARIIAVPAIPRTRSGKVSESAVRDAIHGRALGNTTALANPEVLAFYADLEAPET